MKKSIGFIVHFIVIIIFILAMEYGSEYVWKNYPDKIPTWIVNYQTNKFLAKSKNSLDEILRMCEKKHDEAYAYTLGLVIDYGSLLEHNKDFINQRLELKEAIIIQLKEAIDVLNTMINNDRAEDSDGLGASSKYNALDYFNEYLRDLQ